MLFFTRLSKFLFIMLKQLKFVELDSSNLWLASYDGKKLYLIFRAHQFTEKKVIYSYEVSWETVANLLLAPSHGEYFSKNIRGTDFKSFSVSAKNLLKVIS